MNRFNKLYKKIISEAYLDPAAIPSIKRDFNASGIEPASYRKSGGYSRTDSYGNKIGGGYDEPNENYSKANDEKWNEMCSNEMKTLGYNKEECPLPKTFYFYVNWPSEYFPKFTANILKEEQNIEHFGLRTISCFKGRCEKTSLGKKGFAWRVTLSYCGQRSTEGSEYKISEAKDETEENVSFDIKSVPNWEKARELSGSQDRGYFSGFFWYYMNEDNFKIENGKITSIKFIVGPSMVNENEWIQVEGFTEDVPNEIIHTVIFNKNIQ